MSSKECSSSMKTTRNKFERVVLLVDMDCFYCQVEEKLDPTLRGLPIAVVQYNAWRGGGIIAVNYAARAQGVTRHMRGDEAKAQCPDIKLVQVPNVRGKADLSKYRDGGQEVANVLQKFTPLLERASVDEAYLDITTLVNERLQKMNQGEFVLHPDQLVNTFAVGYENIGEYVGEITTHLSAQADFSKLGLNQLSLDDQMALKQIGIRLLLGAAIANEIRAAVKAETEYECSAGIAHNKIVAKLACGMNKPNKQTILPLLQIPEFFDKLPLRKIKGLGAKFGEEVCERAQVSFLGQLREYTEKQLQSKFDEKNGTWLYYICRGFDFEPVTPRFYSKSIGCCKRFPGRNCISGVDTLTHWLQELAGEISDRLEKDMAEHKRRAKQMVVSFAQDFDGESITSSRTTNLSLYDQQYLTQTSLDVIKANTKPFLAADSDVKLNNAITFLGISVGKFETISRAQNSLQDMFAQQKEKVKEKQRKSEEQAVAAKEEEEEEENLQKFAELLYYDDEEKEAGKENVEEKLEKEETKTNKGATGFLLNYFKKKETKVAEKAIIKRKAPDLQAEEAAEKRCKYNEKEEETAEVICLEQTSTTNVKKPCLSEYAEFALPTLTDFIICEECKRKIPADELAIQTHHDHHFALKLSQQLRQEHQQQEIAKKLNTTAKIPAKPVSKAKSSVPASDISKFLKAVPADEPSTSANAKEQCEKCKQYIIKSQMAEHLDYHFAREVQRELNQVEVLNVSKNEPKAKVKKSTIKPITQFLTKPKS